MSSDMISEIISLFPTPVYKTRLNRELNKKELNFIFQNKSKIIKNKGNISSENSYIINDENFKNLKKELNLIIQDYFDEIISPANNITPYITQSWLNYTETNQYHHQHEHPNSLVSGVFYINCDEKFDKIKFFKKDNSMIKIDVKNWNLWNSESWWLPVKTGDIILFPSSLNHMVENKEGTNTRVSLAFNVFIKGTIGNNKALTELHL